eukprot:2648780-Rhodomonas_salina.1
MSCGMSCYGKSGTDVGYAATRSKEAQYGEDVSLRDVGARAELYGPRPARYCGHGLSSYAFARRWPVEVYTDQQGAEGRRVFKAATGA